MILAFDTYYFDDKAKTVCVKFSHWTDQYPVEVFIDITLSNNDYESGAFYKRELPCILSLLNKINLKEIDLIIIDGYVILDDSGKFGLGGYLYEHLEKKIPIIGVAKTNFFQNDKYKREVLRGESTKPLYITAIGIDIDLVTEQVKNMNGKFRIPTLLKQLDQLTKEDK